MLAHDVVLQNRYRVLRQLGAGGMGTVYEAIDERFDHQVAIKETHFTEEALRKQFEREARLLYKLRHPAMARVIDHFTEGAGQYLVMDFIEGDDLWERLHKRNGPFPPEEVTRWGDQLLDVLRYLHSQEPPVIHRDIKPQNLKLSTAGQIILLDFGLAKGFAGQISRITTSGSIFGYTPNYAPLEQIQGTGTGPRSDLYSLAATLYHLMTGVVPPDVLTRISAMTEGLPDPLRLACELNPQVPQAVAAVLHRAMTISRTQRYDSAAEMRKDLREASHFRPSDEPVEFPTPDEKRARDEETRRRLLAEAENLRRLEDEKRLADERQRREAEERQRREAEEQERLRAEGERLRQEEERRRLEEQERHRLRAEEAERRRLEAEEQARRQAQEEAARRELEERTRAEEARRRAEEEAKRREAGAAQATALAQPPTVSAQQLAPSVAAESQSDAKTVYAPRPARPYGQTEMDAPRAPTQAGDARAPAQGKNTRTIISVAVAVGLVLGFVMFVWLGRIGDVKTDSSTANSAQPKGNEKPAAPQGMAFIPGGDFMMGRDNGTDVSEQPAHKVTVKPFFMDIYEVTVEEYEKFSKMNGRVPQKVSGAGRQPVTGVTWEDANAYARWAGKRLPTEEEWEFAARGPDGRRYPWGNDWQQASANANGVGRVVAEVGSYKGASPFGLYDMVGNVWEWTASPFRAYPGGRLPADLPAGDLKVIRGGSYESAKDYATTTYRTGWPAAGAKTYAQTGFRCVKDVNQ
jgi:formylglycine-generating enzyme required for sulfatase activity